MLVGVGETVVGGDHKRTIQCIRPYAATYTAQWRAEHANQIRAYYYHTKKYTTSEASQSHASRE